ncbi:hypothetical protein BDK51DRAFT_44629 [Blyttiomyces helicus]|uniref:Cyclin-like domain-containing protein n=1 Tax=Blyttiomyces helicus TaxID=388810 RepID=A0A4P9W929_9FUNG|nr:hypothetical protein BDK51DRAFT_44629 [Blyttiomyces helicus]|eukprot:RKO88652.1 hypothetical protein BDK51DRAFT_44629 [Blyttiomyces helicus]
MPMPNNTSPPRSVLPARPRPVFDSSIALHGNDDDVAETARMQRLTLLKAEGDSTFRPAVRYLETVQDSAISAAQRSEAFQLAVNFLDRVCSKSVVRITSYQVLGAACFLIALKVCEPVAPTCGELARLSSGAFSAELLKSTELRVLTLLEWNLIAATPVVFLEYFILLLGLNDEEQNELFDRSDAILAVMQKEYDFLRYRPSVQTAAAMKCAYVSMGRTADIFTSAINKEIEMLSQDVVSIVFHLSLPLMSDIHACAAELIPLISSKIPLYRDFDFISAMSRVADTPASRRRPLPSFVGGLATPSDDSPTPRVSDGASVASRSKRDAGAAFDEADNNEPRLPAPKRRHAEVDYSDEPESAGPLPVVEAPRVGPSGSSLSRDSDPSLHSAPVAAAPTRRKTQKSKAGAAKIPKSRTAAAAPPAAVNKMAQWSIDPSRSTSDVAPLWVPAPASARRYSTQEPYFAAERSP